MNYENGLFNSSYYWFIAMKPYFKKIGDDRAHKYTNDTPVCHVNLSKLRPIEVEKVVIDLEWVEKLNPYVKPGGSYAPTHCRPINKVAIIVPYRNRKINLIIFLRYIHPLLKKQGLQYRIFVIEQYGTEKFNKGSLYNIAFLETQRFGSWDCLVFHDVDLIPEHEGIPYSCNQHPTHMSPAVEMFEYKLPYDTLFGGVTSLTPAQYETVNGYSNCYWNWGGEDDDMQRRLQSKNYTISRYNSTMARYATLPHFWNDIGKERYLFLMLTRLLYIKEGLVTTKYRLIKVTVEKLFTHILADVNPTKLKLDTKSLMNHIVRLHGKSLEYGRQELQLRSISAKALHEYLEWERHRHIQLSDLKGLI
nr:beta-1,4-N-acetylgalactosaminyltransferase bre-4-like [Helicoverpa armigera]